jgi:transposase
VKLRFFFETPLTSRKVIPVRKRAYRAVAIKYVNVNELLPNLAEGLVRVGVDVAEKELFVTLLDSSGVFQRPWKVKQPSEIGQLVQCLKSLSEARPVLVAMESTGTYGDCLRQSLTDAGLVTHRVSAKAVKDYSETFDGVPSNHDGKDAAIIAELLWFGKSKAWPSVPLSEWEAKVERQVAWLDTQQDILVVWLGRIEALLARHWPELTSLLKLNSATLLRMLAHDGGPAAVAGCTEAQKRIRKWGKVGLSEKKIQALLDSSRDTVGVRMANETMQVLQDDAREAMKARQEIRRAKQALKKLATENENTMAMSHVVGAVTACVLWAAVGAPQEFPCGEAYRKAMGFNLRERSSGQHQGKLKITKRGSSLARRWLYFAALRWIQQQPVKAWYLKKIEKDHGRGSGAVVAVMRKLALAVYAVTTRKEPFDLKRLMPGKPYRAVRVQTTVPGGSPPDPQDLTLGAKNEASGAAENRSLTRPASFPAPGTTLRSVPTVALSFAQVNNP